MPWTIDNMPGHLNCLAFEMERRNGVCRERGRPVTAKPEPDLPIPQDPLQGYKAQNVTQADKHQALHPGANANFQSRQEHEDCFIDMYG